MDFRLAAVIISLSLCSIFALADNAANVKIDGPLVNKDGMTTYTLTSPYQSASTTVEVIPPSTMIAGHSYPVLYIPPVNAGTRGRWGDGIIEAKKHDIANTYGVICVSPSFSKTPWYADHPTDQVCSQETYLLKAVLPLIEERYPVINVPEGRLLIGFSKSGVGAFSLLLRHPDIFGYAASWDAPMTMPQPDKWGMPEVYGSPENYASYFIPNLLEKRTADLKDKPARLVLLGYGLFKSEVQATHVKMEALGIPHDYANETKYNHAWGTGWFPAAVKRLMSLRANRLSVEE